MYVPSWLEPFLRRVLWWTRPKYLVGVFPICIDSKERVLLIKKRLGAATGWQLPGGAKEYGVSIEATACRELLEETGLIAQESDTRFVMTQFREEYWDQNIAMLVTKWRGIVTIIDTVEIEDDQWVPIREAYKILYPPHHAMLTAALREWYRQGLAFS